MNARLDANTLQADPALSHISEQWDKDILRQLTDYIAIPAKSPGFDGDWEKHGFIDTVVRNAASWVEAQKVAGLKLEVATLRNALQTLDRTVSGQGDQAKVLADAIAKFGIDPEKANPLDC